MRYFALHENIYATRLANGLEGWDDGAYDEYALREAMRVWSSRSEVLRPGARVLELGCGTGALSCHLASAGLRVTGLDISPAAISHARQVASVRAVEVQFIAASASEWLQTAPPFDVVIDAHMLHCLATNEDRSHLLSGVHDALVEGGEFWTESMLRPATAIFGHMGRVDASGVVWTRCRSAEHSEDAVEYEAEFWIPSRYLAPDAATLAAEISAARLELIEYEVVETQATGSTPDFRGRFRRRRNDA